VVFVVYFLKSYVGFAEFAGAKILYALALGLDEAGPVKEPHIAFFSFLNASISALIFFPAFFICAGPLQGLLISPAVVKAEAAKSLGKGMSS
jgi:hypothetical protein